MAERESCVGKVFEDRYRILRLIGEGGMGAVYEAEHVVVGRRVAIKVLHADMAQDPSIVGRFHNEARAAGSIGNEHIVEVLDFGEVPAPYLVMEHLEGSGLGEILDREGPLAPERACALMLQILDALQAAHDKEIVHRDLKPENVLVVEKAGRHVVKLLDFGISKLKADKRTGPLTQTGTVLGTPYYMSPEQALGMKDLSGLTDIYSAGVILYRALVGRLPFVEENYNALLVKIMSDPVPSPRSINPGVPEEMERIILKAMAREQSERFGSCAEFGEALAAFMQGRGTDVETAVESPTAVAARLAAARERIVAGARRAASTAETVPALSRASTVAGPGAPRRGRAFPIALAATVVAAVAAAGLYFAFRGGKDGRSGPAPAGLEGVSPSPGPSGQGGPTTPGDSAVQASEAPPAVAVPAAPAGAGEFAAGTIRFFVSARPSGAKISLDGVEAQGNPVDLRFRRDGVARTLRIEAPGYLEKSQLVSFGSDVIMDVELEPEIPVEVPPVGVVVPDAGQVRRPAGGVRAPRPPDAGAAAAPGEDAGAAAPAEAVPATHPAGHGPFREVDIDAFGRPVVAPPVEAPNPYRADGG